jgi:hypothetical protein
MYQHLRRYRRPEHFSDWTNVNRAEYYVAYGRHRDSDTLTESNFRSLLRLLGGESDTVIIPRDSHFLVGWVEAIYIHEADERACRIADEALGRLEQYPVLEEGDWSELEYGRAAEYWERASVSERIDWCGRYDVSIFAARRSELPEDPRGELVAALAA